MNADSSSGTSPANEAANRNLMGATITELRGWPGAASALAGQTVPAGQGFPAPGAGAGNAMTSPLGCAVSGPP